jgi:hypothetical protein
MEHAMPADIMTSIAQDTYGRYRRDGTHDRLAAQARRTAPPGIASVTRHRLGAALISVGTRLQGITPTPERAGRAEPAPRA